MRREFDLDVLADYTAGLLAGTDAAAIAELVATDPVWREAFTALVEADAAVRVQLRQAARTRPDVMPDDIAARIDTALTAAARDDRPAGSGVILLDEARTARSAGRVSDPRRRRRFATAVATVAAAAVAVIGGIAVIPNLATQRSDGGTAVHSESDTAGGAPAPAMAASGDPGPRPDMNVVIISSGVDYGPRTVGELPTRAQAAVSPSATGTAAMRADAAADLTERLRGVIPTGLTRLTDLDALADCLEQVRPLYPGTPAALDYARYEGRPALLVLVRSGTTAAVVVVGPDCGIADASIVTAVPVS